MSAYKGFVYLCKQNLHSQRDFDWLLDTPWVHPSSCFSASEFETRHKRINYFAAALKTPHIKNGINSSVFYRWAVHITFPPRSRT